MSIASKLVFLLKAPSENENHDKYEVMLTNRGYKVQEIKTLEFEFKNLPKLKDNLDQPDAFNGMIFASPRCVKAVKLALNGEKINGAWLDKDNYVVGEATYETALTDLNLECLGKETGNANNLADVLNDKNYDKPFLFPHGNLKMDILKHRLENIKLVEVCVYDTISNPRIETEIKEATNNYTNVPEFIVFFSPSGVKSTISLLKNMEKVKAIAIGPTTKQSMMDQKIAVYATAHRPTPEDLIIAMAEIK